MKKRVFLNVLTAVILVSFLSSLCAGFLYGSSSVQRNYVGGETIKGYLNISLNGDSSSAQISSSLGGSIGLIDLLKNNSFSEGQEYTCSVPGCKESYKTTGSAITSVSMQNNSKKNFGFKLTGLDVEVDSLKFSVSSNIDSSCSSEIEINLFGMKNKSIQSYKYVNETCFGIQKGCYDSNSGSKEWLEIANEPLCEKMYLPSAPAFQVGAFVGNASSGMGVLKMELFDSSWEMKGSCTLPRHKQQVENINCTIEYANPKEQNYFVCIFLASGNAKYNISSESESPVCGNAGEGFQNYALDYDVFAQPLKFKFSDIVINESSFENIFGDSLSARAHEYIMNAYGGVGAGGNCSGTNGCTLPVEIAVKNAQEITFENPEVRYRKLGSGGGTTGNSQIYSVLASNSTLSSKYLKLDLEKSGIELPISTSQRTIQFYLDGAPLLPNALSINVTPGFTFDLFPKQTLVGITKVFEITSSVNVTSVSWDFGDGSPAVTTQSKKAEHRYLVEGIFKVQIEVVNSNGISVKKTFNVVSGDAETASKRLLEEYENNIKNLSGEINSFDAWVSGYLKKTINISEINSSLIELRERISSGENYSVVLNSILLINVPKSISIKNTGNALPIAIGFENMDSSFVPYLSDGENVSELGTEQEDELYQAIIDWNFDNFNSNIDYKVLSKSQSGEFYPLLTQFKINAQMLDQSTPASYLIIPYPKDEITFKENYGQKEISNGVFFATAVPVSASRAIEFILPAQVEISELGAYIAPEISELITLEPPPGLIDDNPRPKIAKWMYVALVFLFFVIYIVLQEWYKRKYESHLFPSRDDLYNLINFIFNSRMSGLDDWEIRKKLGTFNWKSEQLAYAFKKIDGKRTGMWEIPIFKFIENRKVKREIEKRRQTVQGDARFIKSSY